MSENVKDAIPSYRLLLIYKDKYEHILIILLLYIIISRSRAYRHHVHYFTFPPQQSVRSIHLNMTEHKNREINI